MLHKKLLILIYMLLVPLSSVFAFSIEQPNSDITEDYNQVMKPLQVTGNAIKWEIFAKTKEKEECGKDEEGFDLCLTKPIYSPEITALDNKEVTLTGFMFPLDPSEKQKNFLIGPYPTSCPFHYHVTPAQIVEVILNKPIEFSYDPVTVTGKLSLKYNEETGIFYYLMQN